MSDRLTLLLSQLYQLTALDQDFKVFGANSHQYARNPPLSASEVADFTQRTGVTLPSEYQTYLTEISNGGAGACYGLYAFQAAINAAVWEMLLNQQPEAKITEAEVQAAIQKDLRPFFQPFPITQAQVSQHIQDILEYADDEQKVFEITPASTGFLYLNEYGCGGYYVLVISGELAGTVWFMQSGEYFTPVYTALPEGGFKLWSFFDLLEWWLDESLAQLEKREPVPPAPPDPLQTKKLVYDQQGRNQIPTEVFACKNLRQLIYTRNDPAGETPLPPELFTLTDLRVLDLHMNGITHLPPAIGQLQKLVKLDLNYNYQLTALPAEIGTLLALKKLHLAYCGLQTLPPTIGNLKNLELLSLFSGKLQSLPDAIGGLTNLRHLYLGQQPELAQLPETMGELQQLTTLNLEYNQLAKLPAGIVRCQQLALINLRVDALDFDDAFAKLAQLPHLKTLHIAAPPQPTAAIGLLTQLTELVIETNYHLYRTEPDTVCPLHAALCQTQLKVIRLMNGQARLPADLSPLQTLRELYLNAENFNGLNESVRALPNLKRIEGYGPACSREHLAQLQKWLPQADIRIW